MTRSLRRAEPAQTVLETPNGLETVMTRSPDVRSPFKRSWQHPIDDPRPPRAEPVRRSWDHLMDLETVMTRSSDVLSRFKRSGEHQPDQGTVQTCRRAQRRRFRQSEEHLM